MIPGFAVDPGVGVAVWASEASWTTFAGGASVYSIEQSLLHSSLVPGSVPGTGAQETLPSRGSGQSGKWAGGSGQGWGGQAQLQVWPHLERDLLIQPSPIEHKAAWAKGYLIKKT